MAQDIVPIELGLPRGDVITLWAPRWREGDEEWEAFLGHGDDLYAFPDAAHLAAFVRTRPEHDLADHPAWHVVPGLSVAELIPDDEHQYDLVGVPELMAEEPDTWVISELADIVSMVRSLADVCDLDQVHEVLDAASGFDLLDEGVLPFNGRDGAARWNELAQVVAREWDGILDIIDSAVTAPTVDGVALRGAREELARVDADQGADPDEPATRATEDDGENGTDDPDEEPDGFWIEVGIDPIKIVTDHGEYYTLRCYLDDEPLFLGSGGKIDVFRSPKALTRHLAATGGDSGNDLADLLTWPDVVTAAMDGSIAIDIDSANTYVLAGIAEDIADGPDGVDPTQLDLAVELLTDAADWADDDRVHTALAPSERLGWLVSFILRPDPTRLAPSAPFDAEQDEWRHLVSAFEARLSVH